VTPTVRLWIHARDPRRAATFYAAVFGWVLPTEAGRRCWIVTSSDDQRLSLDNTEANGLGTPTVHVTDLQVTSRLAVTAGGEILVSRIPLPGTGWIAYLADTEGNLIGIMQDDPAAHWLPPDDSTDGGVPDQQPKTNRRPSRASQPPFLSGPDEKRPSRPSAPPEGRPRTA